MEQKTINGEQLLVIPLPSGVSINEILQGIANEARTEIADRIDFGVGLPKEVEWIIAERIKLLNFINSGVIIRAKEGGAR